MSESLKDIIVDIIVPVFFTSCAGVCVWLLFAMCQDVKRWKRRYED